MNAGILLGKGDGTFQQFEYFAPGIAAFSLAAPDFNQNGRLDLALSTNGAIELLVQ